MKTNIIILKAHLYIYIYIYNKKKQELCYLFLYQKLSLKYPIYLIRAKFHNICVYHKAFLKNERKNKKEKEKENITK